MILFLLVPGFFLWAAIHELSHLAAIAATYGTHDWYIIPWPHRHEGYWYFARYHAVPETHPRLVDVGIVAIAPRIPGLIALAAFPFTAPHPWLAVLVGCGLVDFAVGSIGRSPSSDLCRAAYGFGLNRWLFRLAGWALVCISAGLFVWRIL